MRKVGEVGMTDREKAILWLDSFVKNKEPFTLIPKQLIRLMHDVLKEQEIQTESDLKEAKMEEILYAVEVDGNTVAEKMDIQTTCVLVQALFEKYYNDKKMLISIHRMDWD